MSGRQLPAHIRAALEGNAADSAGRPWADRDLSGDGNPLHAFDDDDGSPDAGLVTAVAGLLGTPGQPGPRERAVFAALGGARVFIPIVAQVAAAVETDDGLTADKEADMALVTLTAPDGRAALPVFSSTARLASWHPTARPVAVVAPRAALAAAAEQAELLVLDPGADVTFVLRRPAVWALAQGTAWLPSYEDEGLASLVGDVAAGEEFVVGLELRPGAGVLTRAADGSIASGGGPGPELRMDVRLREGLSANQVKAAVTSLRARLLGLPAFVERVDSLDIKLMR